MNIKFYRKKANDAPYVIAHVAIRLDVGIQISGLSLCRQDNGGYNLLAPRKVIGDKLVVMTRFTKDARKQITAEVVKNYEMLKEQGIWQVK